MAYREVDGDREWAHCILNKPGPSMIKVAVFADGSEWECTGVAETEPQAGKKDIAQRDIPDEQPHGTPNVRFLFRESPWDP